MIPNEFTNKGFKSFVAPCIGGPKDGKLFRADCRFTSVIIPVNGRNGIDYPMYVLKELSDGSKIWEFVPTKEE